tara:strand:+ start:1135 stop:1308 length:174 start_codon:yes stop_codon:yes gene_type:complete
MMELHIDLTTVDQEAVDAAVLAMVEALTRLDVTAEEVIVAMGELFRLIAEEKAETIH